MGIDSAFVQAPTVPSTGSPFDNLSSIDTLTATQSKALSTPNKLQQKANNLGIDLSQYGVQDPTSTLRGRIGNDIRGIGSSFIKAAGGIYDFGALVGDAFQESTGGVITPKNEFLDSLSTNETADSYTGFDRTSLNQAGQQISKDVEAGNYGSALLTAALNADQYLADSAGSAAEFALGGAARKVGSYALEQALKKGVKKAVIKDAAEKAVVKDTAEVIAKDATLNPTVVQKVGEVVKKAVKSAPGAATTVSPYAMDAVARDAEEYQKNNNGELPSASWIATNYAAKTLTGLFQKEILLGLGGKTVKSTTLETVKDLAKIMGTKKAKEVLAQNAFRNGKLVISDAAFEGLQEAIEGATSQVATQVDSKKYKGQSVLDVLTRPDNINQNIEGAIIGTATGGVAASVPASVSTTATASAALTKGLVKATAGKAIEKGKEAGAKASYHLLSQEDKDAIKAKYEAEDALYQEAKTNMETENEEIKGYETIDDLKKSSNEDIQADIKRYEEAGKEITPDVVQKIKNRAIAQNNKRIDTAKIALEAARAKDYTYRVYQNVKDKVPEHIQEKIGKAKDKVVEYTKDAYGATLDTVQNLETTAARAVLDDITAGKTHKEIGKALNKGLEKITDHDLDALIEMTKSNEKVQSVIKAAKEAREKAREHLGLRTTKVVENLDDYTNIKKNDASTKAKALSLQTELLNVSSHNITDPDVLAQVQSALDTYAASEHSNPSIVGTIKRQLKKADKTKSIFDAEDVTTGAKNAVDKVLRGSKKFYNKAKELGLAGTKDLGKHIQDYIATQTFNKANVKNLASKLKANDPNVELNEDEHTYMLNRLAKHDALKLKGEKPKLTELEKLYKANYGERVDDYYDAMEAALEAAFENLQASKENSSESKPTTETKDSTEEPLDTTNGKPVDPLQLQEDKDLINADETVATEQDIEALKEDLGLKDC